MAVSVQKRGDKFQLRVTHRLLPRSYISTFEADEEARSYGRQLHDLLDRGVVPDELSARPAAVADDPMLIKVIRAYSKAAPVTDSDSALLDAMMMELAGLRVSRCTFDWAAIYVSGLKVKQHLAPSTIRKRVGVLGRVMDWHLARICPPGGMPLSNVFRLLPTGYSAYSRVDAEQLAKSGKAPRRDQQRDRRLLPDEETRLRAALAGVKRPDRERALAPDPAFQLLLDLILGTGLRLIEAYRLRTDQIDHAGRYIRVEGSKGHRGVIKPRTVPLRPALALVLADWCRDRVGLLFPFWDGSPHELVRTTRRLSYRFTVAFEYAKVPDITEHDLRHEATCRWVELKDSAGRWIFSDIEICRIMGWTDPRLMLRYASLRGEDLAARMG